MTTALPRRLILAWVLALCALGGAYQTKGNIGLVAGSATGDAIDLKNRDLEQAFFAGGTNPYDRMVGSQPPWGYAFGQVLVWPGWPAVRAYFAVLNLIALLFLMWWAYHAPRDAPVESRLLLMASVLAFGGSCTATEVGQVSIIVTALLAGALWCDRTGRQYLCGLLVALSLIKPTISVPFAIALLVTMRMRAAAAAAAYGAVATAIAWLVVGVSPLQMLRQMAASASSFVHDGTLGLVDVASAMGASPQAVVWLPLLVAIPGIVLMIWTRPSLPLAFATAAVWGRLWTYHKSYDDVMLVFVLVPLGVYALSHRPTRSTVAAFVAMGLLAWMPGQLLARAEIQVLQLLVWPVALAILIARSRHRELVLVAPPARSPLEQLHA